MDAIQDFEDMLEFLDKHNVRYLIIGGLAFIYHAKPRYTKDMGLWIDPEPENIKRTNQALAEFGSPILLDPNNINENPKKLSNPYPLIAESGRPPSHLLLVKHLRIYHVGRLTPLIIRDQLRHHPNAHVIHTLKSESGGMGGQDHIVQLEQR